MVDKKDINKILQEMEIPEPDEAVKNAAIKASVDEFNRQRESLQKNIKGNETERRLIGRIQIFLNLLGGYAMKKITINSLLILLALGLTMPVFARGSLYDMQREQRWRIKEGIHSGELTRKEARVLRREQRNIRRMKRHFVRDGRISRQDRKSVV